MNRPNDCKRVHFSCGEHGTRSIPPDWLRAGDTASGLDSDGRSMLWRCVELIGGRGFWTTIEAWTERGAAVCIGAADMLVVIDEGGASSTFGPRGVSS